MKFTPKDLDRAAKDGVITEQARDALKEYLGREYAHRPTLSFANVLYYLGGLIVIASMTFYATVAWEILGGVGHLAVALIYAGILLWAGNRLWKKGRSIPGGILITAAVSMTPLAVYGFQETTGLWAWGDPGAYRGFYIWIKSPWFFMELATVATGILALRFYRFPFIMLPVAFALWFMSMDLSSVIYGPDFSWEQRKVVSIWFGLAMLAASFAVDCRTRRDYAFWGYLFGMLAFWGGLTSLDSDSELGKFAYFCVNALLIGLSTLLRRRVFIVFGSAGVAMYLGHLAYEVFEDTLLFTFALSLGGLAIIGLGILYHKRERALEEKLAALLPGAWKRVLPQYRD